MKKLVKILSFCLVCVLACFCFVGCVDGGFVVPGLPSKDDINKLIDDEVQKQKEEMKTVFKENFNGIKIVYLPSTPTNVESEKALEVIDEASETALEYIKITRPDLLLEYATFEWTDGVNVYEVQKFDEQNYHYFVNLTSIIYTDGTNFEWFDGEQWVVLSADAEDETHFFYDNGLEIIYFVIDAVNSDYYITDITYSQEIERLNLLDEKYSVLYFYINPLNLQHSYYYNETETFDYTDGESVDLTLYVLNGQEEQPTSMNLILDLDRFIKVFKNKLSATFINSVCELSTESAIATGDDVDGQTQAYISLLQNKIKTFNYFGLKTKDILAGKTYLKSIPVTLDDELVDDSLSSASYKITQILGKTWQYNIYIENYTIDQFSNYIEDEKLFLDEKIYLSVVYMTKNEYTPYEQEATTTLYPDECTIYFGTDRNEGSQTINDVYATFMFKAKGDVDTVSYNFNIVHDGDIMLDEEGNPFEDADGNPVRYEGNDALNLEIFEKAEDVQNVLQLSTGFNASNDETANGANWSGVVKTFNGTEFNSGLINAISQTQSGSVEQIIYTSQTHDVLQIVFDKTESFKIAGVGSLSLYDETQIDWDSFNELMSNSEN